MDKKIIQKFTTDIRKIMDSVSKIINEKLTDFDVYEVNTETVYGSGIEVFQITYDFETGKNGFIELIDVEDGFTVAVLSADGYDEDYDYDLQECYDMEKGWERRLEETLIDFHRE